MRILATFSASACIFAVSALAADGVLAQKRAQLSELQRKSETLDNKIRSCNKSKNSWKVATVIGSVGTAATATGAVVQAVQLNKAKKAGDTENTTETAKTEKSK